MTRGARASDGRGAATGVVASGSRKISKCSTLSTVIGAAILRNRQDSCEGATSQPRLTQRGPLRPVGVPGQQATRNGSHSSNLLGAICSLTTRLQRGRRGTPRGMHAAFRRKAMTLDPIAVGTGGHEVVPGGSATP